VFIEDSKHSAASLESIGASDEDIDISQELLFARFEEWSKTYSKQYNSEEERNYRFSIWMKNDAEIRKHNNAVPPPSFTMGHNQFSDMTEDEFGSIHTIALPP